MFVYILVSAGIFKCVVVFNLQIGHPCQSKDSCCITMSCLVHLLILWEPATREKSHGKLYSKAGTVNPQHTTNKLNPSSKLKGHTKNVRCYHAG